MHLTLEQQVEEAVSFFFCPFRFFQVPRPTSPPTSLFTYLLTYLVRLCDSHCTVLFTRHVVFSPRSSPLLLFYSLLSFFFPFFVQVLFLQPPLARPECLFHPISPIIYQAFLVCSDLTFPFFFTGILAFSVSPLFFPFRTARFVPGPPASTRVATIHCQVVFLLFQDLSRCLGKRSKIYRYPVTKNLPRFPPSLHPPFHEPSFVPLHAPSSPPSPRPK